VSGLFAATAVAAASFRNSLRLRGGMGVPSTEYKIMYTATY